MDLDSNERKEAIDSPTGLALAVLHRVGRALPFSVRDNQAISENITRRMEHGLVWVPNIGSLSPGMTDRFSQNILQRYPAMAEKFAIKSPDESGWDPDDFVLPPAGSASTLSWPGDGQSEPTPQLPAALALPPSPPDQRPEPAPAIERLIPALAPVQRRSGVRPQSRIDEITPANRPTGQPGKSAPAARDAGHAAPVVAAPDLREAEAAISRAIEPSAQPMDQENQSAQSLAFPVSSDSRPTSEAAQPGVRWVVPENRPSRQPVVQERSDPRPTSAANWPVVRISEQADGENVARLIRRQAGEPAEPDVTGEGLSGPAELSIDSIHEAGEVLARTPEIQPGPVSQYSPGSEVSNYGAVAAKPVRVENFDRIEPSSQPRVSRNIQPGSRPVQRQSEVNDSSSSPQASPPQRVETAPIRLKKPEAQSELPRFNPDLLDSVGVAESPADLTTFSAAEVPAQPTALELPAVIGTIQPETAAPDITRKPTPRQTSAEVGPALSEKAIPPMASKPAQQSAPIIPAEQIQRAAEIQPDLAVEGFDLGTAPGGPASSSLEPADASLERVERPMVQKLAETVPSPFHAERDRLQGQPQPGEPHGTAPHPEASRSSNAHEAPLIQRETSQSPTPAVDFDTPGFEAPAEISSAVPGASDAVRRAAGEAESSETKADAAPPSPRADSPIASIQQPIAGKDRLPELSPAIRQEPQVISRKFEPVQPAQEVVRRDAQPVAERKMPEEPGSAQSTSSIPPLDISMSRRMASKTVAENPDLVLGIQSAAIDRIPSVQREVNFQDQTIEESIERLPEVKRPSDPGKAPQTTAPDSGLGNPPIHRSLPSQPEAYSARPISALSESSTLLTPKDSISRKLDGELFETPESASTQPGESQLVRVNGRMPESSVERKESKIKPGSVQRMAEEQEIKEGSQPIGIPAVQLSRDESQRPITSPRETPQAEETSAVHLSRDVVQSTTTSHPDEPKRAIRIGEAQIEAVQRLPKAASSEAVDPEANAPIPQMRRKAIEVLPSVQNQDVRIERAVSSDPVEERPVGLPTRAVRTELSPETDLNLPREKYPPVEPNRQPSLDAAVLSRQAAKINLPITRLPARINRSVQNSSDETSAPEASPLIARRAAPFIPLTPPAILPQTRGALAPSEATLSQTSEMPVAPAHYSYSPLAGAVARMAELVLPAPVRPEPVNLPEAEFVQRSVAASKEGQPGSHSIPGEVLQRSPGAAAQSRPVDPGQAVVQRAVMEAATQAEAPAEINLDELARQVYPLIKRLLAIERERFSSR